MYEINLFYKTQIEPLSIIIFNLLARVAIASNLLARVPIAFNLLANVPAFNVFARVAIAFKLLTRVAIAFNLLPPGLGVRVGHMCSARAAAVAGGRCGAVLRAGEGGGAKG